MSPRRTRKHSQSPVLPRRSSRLLTMRPGAWNLRGPVMEKAGPGLIPSKPKEACSNVGPETRHNRADVFPEWRNDMTISDI